MNAQLILSVDGGGTKTEAILADTGGLVLGIGRASGSNALSVGRESAIGAVKRAISEAMKGAPYANVAMAKLFIPGFGHCLPLDYPFETPVYGDAPNAYFGALGEPNGVTVLLGTGSFAVSYDEKGAETSVGGWGPMLGDEGSGYDIGRRAVRAALARMDEGKPETALGRDILAHYGAENAARLVHIIYHGGCDREKMARLCPIVGAHAERGEADAAAVMEEAARAIVRLAVSLKERLKLKEAPLALTGGVTGLRDTLFVPVKKHLAGTGLTLVKPRFTPALGGIIYTYWALLGHLPDQDALKSYAESYQQVKGN